MRGIVTLTVNPALDKMTSVPRVICDKKLRCQKIELRPGGGGINVSRAIRNLGGRSTAFFTAGGHQGKRLSCEVRRCGVDSKAVWIGGETREHLNVTETKKGRHYRFVTPGPRLTQSEWKRLRTAVLQQGPPPDYLVMSGSLPPGVPASFYAGICEGVRRSWPGTRVVIDAGREAVRRAAVRKAVFLIKLNIREFRYLRRKKLRNTRHILEEAERFVDGGYCRLLVVSMGKRGAVYADSSGARHLRAPEVKSRSVTGAGDSMVGAITLALSRKKDVCRAVVEGMAAGASAAERPPTHLCQRSGTARWRRQINRQNGIHNHSRRNSHEDREG
ncbi:MAG: 1-phosphofructokinase family hexose kinase [Candidatus Omnitrophica bacterium]|nr:1-phosphofructokinase family hexose kinase [Candidatus Omnitrophota bacterium]